MYDARVTVDFDVLVVKKGIGEVMRDVMGGVRAAVVADLGVEAV